MAIWPALAVVSAVTEMLMPYLLIGLGGFIGANARFVHVHMHVRVHDKS